MNWGKGIVLVFVLFASFIGGMVYQMVRQRVDLVSDNYYQNELEYQQQIERVRNANQTASASITYQAEQQQVVCALPINLQQGKILFYRPGDRHKDFQVTIPAQHKAQEVISTRDLGKGNWRVQFTWSDGAREYYKESQIYL